MTESISLEKFIGKGETRETHSLTQMNDDGYLVKKQYQKCGRKECNLCVNGKGHIGPYYWRVKNVKIGAKNYKRVWKYVGKTPR